LQWDAEPEHAGDPLAQPAGGLDPAALLDLQQQLEHGLGVDRARLERADRREDVALEARQDVGGMLGRPPRRSPLVPAPGELLECRDVGAGRVDF
jgi:hypothetical protein